MLKQIEAPYRKQWLLGVHGDILALWKTTWPIQKHVSLYDRGWNATSSIVYPLPPKLHHTLYIVVTLQQNWLKYHPGVFIVLASVEGLQTLHIACSEAIDNHGISGHTGWHRFAFPSTTILGQQYLNSLLVPDVLPMVSHDLPASSVNAIYCFAVYTSSFCIILVLCSLYSVQW